MKNWAVKMNGRQQLKPEYFKSKEFKDKILRWKKILKGMNINSKT